MIKPQIENNIQKPRHYSSYFSEDEHYDVTTECRGEFGGKLLFRMPITFLSRS
ncbi:hypothetical protein [Flavobacterium cyanobacteriorum]|uniref:hypothetical protein n=1 Tax=Flavobacterium cyanobacteriorum TaxID=2022802 RepID=UPI0013FE08AB|nr:hypothetical protein [Flavobacterium cyanobacteriorum]